MCFSNYLCDDTAKLKAKVEFLSASEAGGGRVLQIRAGEDDVH